MNFLLKYLCIYALLFSLFGFISFSPKQNTQMMRYDFGISITPSMTGGLLTYWIVGNENGKVLQKIPITTENFILQMLGKQKSYANYEQHNLFDSAKVDVCFWDYYFDRKYYKTFCWRMEDLWMLRYKRNPTCNYGCEATEDMRVDGLTANTAFASEAQMQILKSYGISNFNDIIFGENLLRLFRDFCNDDWRSKYEALK